MKLKVYIIKRKQLIWAAIILVALIIAAILAISLRAQGTLNTMGSTQTTRADINNDGKFDTVLVKADEKTGKYSVDISCSDGNGYSLEADPSVKTLGYYTNWWPMNVSIHDINGDNKAEVVLQASDGKNPILHIFSYRDNKMERIAAGKYSTFGFLKNPKDNSQTLILGAKKNNSIELSYFNAKTDKLAPQISSASMTLGKDTLNSLVGFLEKKEVETFSSSKNGSLENKIAKGNYLDSVIYDAKYTSYNIPSEYTYILRTSPMENNQREYAAYKVKVSLEKYDSKNPQYKITNIEKIKN